MFSDLICLLLIGIGILSAMMFMGFLAMACMPSIMDVIRRHPPDDSTLAKWEEDTRYLDSEESIGKK